MKDYSKVEDWLSVWADIGDEVICLNKSPKTTLQHLMARSLTDNPNANELYMVVDGLISSMPEQRREIFYYKYMHGGDDNWKWKKVGVSKDRWYHELAKGKEWMAGWLFAKTGIEVAA